MLDSFGTRDSVVLTEAELRSVERQYCDVSPPLMWRAGRAAAQVALGMLAKARERVLVLCGPGNNGGDGFVVATELLRAGCQVLVVCMADPARAPADARAAREEWLSAGGEISLDFNEDTCEDCALVIDALFGIGLTRPLEGAYGLWVERLGNMQCPVLALDIPSGLHSESGSALGRAVKASRTATFIALKPGLLTLDGPDHCGKISLHDLGLSLPKGFDRRISPASFREHLLPRRHNVHKGSFGSLGVIGGAKGMLGAALLATRAALHLGTGRVFLAALDAAAPSVDLMNPEIMARTPGELASQVTALAVGPGLGQSETSFQTVQDALAFSGPLVLDADALNLVAESPHLRRLLGGRGQATVITPHPAEAARLLSTSVSDVQSDRVASGCGLARTFNAVAVLKGCGSVIAVPDGRWFVNTSGNSGMAAAGMGDVLTGLIGALLAQGWPALAATQAGVHLHGCSAELLAQEGVGPVGLTPSETIVAARKVLNAWISMAGKIAA